jgi:hypothetical protein
MKNATMFTLSRTANVVWNKSNVTQKKENLKSEGFTDFMWKEVTLFVKKIHRFTEKIWRFQK